MKKPTVFLSHSKADKGIIERLANDLRRVRINVWYDEWEIPPGESFRRKIFEDGIPNCDLFFVYLTPNSKDSFWVDREMDSAIIQDADRGGKGNVVAFVDSETTRNSLAADLRALHIPELNEDNYNMALTNIIAKTWETTSKRILNEESKNFRIEKLELEKEIAELKNKLLTKESNEPLSNVDEIISNLEQKKYTYNDITLNLKYIFNELSTLLASGTNIWRFTHRVEDMFDVNDKKSDSGLRGYEFIGELIILNLVKREPATDEYDEQYSLTDLGSLVIKKLRK